jgi:hypothetical protein
MQYALMPFLLANDLVDNRELCVRSSVRLADLRTVSMLHLRLLNVTNLALELFSCESWVMNEQVTK